MSRWRHAAVIVLVAGSCACGGRGVNTGGPTGGTGETGGGGGGGGGTANRAPSVTASVNTTFGIAQLTAFSFTASATDPDGDQVTLSWDFGDGTQSSGTSVSHTYTSGGTMTVIVTASDGKLSTLSAPINVTIGTLSGIWDVAVSDSCSPDPYSATLSQTAGVATGSFLFSRKWCNVPAGTTARTDPAEPGTITAAGKVEIRVKVGNFTDFYMRGTMGATGRIITGGIFNSGWVGQSFTATKR